jgi:hypothetical protein
MRRGAIILGTAVGVAAVVIGGGMVLSQQTGDWHEDDDKGVTPQAILVTAALASGVSLLFTVPLTTDLGDEIDP